MNLKNIHSFIFVLLLAVSANSLHQWQPHSEEAACEVCILNSHFGDVPTESNFHIQIAELSVHQWQHVQSQHLIQGVFIEPIRGSPLKIS